MDDAASALAPAPAVRYRIHVNRLNQPQGGMRLFDAEGRRLYLSEEERRAFVLAAAKAASAPRRAA